RKVSLNGVGYGNFQLLAGGVLGTILTSIDGANWIQRESGTQSPLNALSYGNGQFVAVGDLGTFVTSHDGVNWIRRQSGTEYNLSSVAYGNSLYVAVSSLQIGSIIISSSDGVSWLPQGPNFGFEAVGYAKGQFVGVFHDRSTIGQYFFLTSSDRVNWVWHPLPLQNYLSYNISDSAIAYG